MSGEATVRRNFFRVFPPKRIGSSTAWRSPPPTRPGRRSSTCGTTPEIVLDETLVNEKGNSKELELT